MNLDDLTQRRSAWLREGGPDSDVVVSSRIRLARNISGFPFTNRACEQERQKIVEVALKAIADVMPNDSYVQFDFQELSRDDAMFLRERQIVSAEFAESCIPRALVMSEDEEYAIMINEEDHLRIQTLASGFALADLWKKIDALDNLLESKLDYSYDEQYGYLTACPSNVGTGVRVGVMLHLPGLIETREINRALLSAKKLNLEVRGMYGEGARALCDFFQISNRKTLGVSEEEVVDKIAEVAQSIMGYERDARATILENNRDGLLDRCARSLGALKSARFMSVSEASACLSSLRLGIKTEVVSNLTGDLVDELIMNVQPVHLKRQGEALGYDVRDDDALRAEYLRDRLAGMEL